MKNLIRATSISLAVLIQLQAFGATSPKRKIASDDDTRPISNPYCSRTETQSIYNQDNKREIRCKFTCVKPDGKSEVAASCIGTAIQQREGNINLGETLACPNINICVEQALQEKPGLDLQWVPTKKQ